MTDRTQYSNYKYIQTLTNIQEVTEEQLNSILDKIGECVKRAQSAGVDIIEVHGDRLIGSFCSTLINRRTDSYGGSFENRSRFLRQTVQAVRKAVGDDFIVACRFNVFDAHPYPYGFGCDKEDMWKFDPTEPAALVKMLVENGVDLLSNSGGNPYYIYPQVTRPFDKSSYGIPTPQEHPLESMARLFSFTRTVQKAAGDIPVVGNGYTWLRQFLPYAGAANLADGSCSFVGLGRESFAYPDAPHDLMTTGAMDPGKCCVTCSMCTQIMRDHGRTGCVIRDSALYGPMFKEYNAEAVAREHRK